MTLLDDFDRVLTAWADGPGIEAAVRDTVARHGYANEDVAAQLAHVVQRCRADTIRQVLRVELGDVDGALDDAPTEVLVLASGNVPGLVIESIAATAAIGARAIVRPSRSDTTCSSFADVARRLGTAHALFEVLPRGDTSDPSDLPWDRADAVLVFGSDATIAYAQDHINPSARNRMAAYGSRQGIAIVDAASVDPANASWATRLADDVLTFRQRGCMSPSWLYVIGPPAVTAPCIDLVGRELALARERHLAPGVDDRLAQRRASDADVLGAIVAGLAPDARAMHAGDARLTVVPVADDVELSRHVASLGSLLQTAVIACAPARRNALIELAGVAGCTRTCVPGQAHLPDPLWPQDGIGRIAPLLGRSALPQ